MYFLNINKPKGVTSFDVIRQLRRKLKIRAIGHAGTLDPLASGVMQIAVGSATRLLDYLPSDKSYIADIKFGYISDTFDEEGEKTFVKEPEFTLGDFELVLKSFIGKTLQIPPKYSAIKLKGQKLCDIVRKNPQVAIEVPSREIEIYSIDIIEFKNNTAKIKVHCAKGTYIRSLVDDIGKMLTCGAYMTDLIRISAGNFKLEDSNNLDEELRQISPLDAIDLEVKELNNTEYVKISNGNFISVDKEYLNEFILLTNNKKLVSIAKISDNLIKPKKFFGGE